MVDLLTFEPIPTRRLPVLTYEQVVRRAIGSPYVRRALKALGEKAGIAKRIHPHGLRHSCAAELATERLDLRVIQAQLGHSSIATTDRYISHLAPTAVVEAIGARVCALEAGR